MNTIDIWQNITDRIATALPTCLVTRAYDISATFEGLCADDAPRIVVKLETFTSEPRGTGSYIANTLDTYTFSVSFIRKLPATLAAQTAAIDGLLPTLMTLSDTLQYKKVITDAGSYALLNPTIGPGNTLYDAEVLREYGVFVTTIVIGVKTERTHG